MARIRTIKPEFWTDEQVMECSPLARLFFIGLWNFCDDGGNHALSEKTLKALIFPGDDIDSTSIRRMIVELSANDLLRLYEASGKQYLNVSGWRHQKIDRPTIKHPDFPGDRQLFPDEIWPAGHVLDESSTNARRVLDESSPPEGNGREEEKIKSTVERVEKPTRPKDETPYQEILALYREVCGGKFLGAEVLTAERKRNIRKTYELKVRGEYPFRDRGLDFWRKFFERCTTNRHWCGENDRGWKASLEFITKESNVLKVLGV